MIYDFSLLQHVLPPCRNAQFFVAVCWLNFLNVLNSYSEMVNISNWIGGYFVIRQYMEQDVYQALQDRLKLIFEEFDSIPVYRRICAQPALTSSL